MIHHLHIENFALIDSLRLDLAEGLTVLTGETGAGKSVVLDALEFLLGGRGSADFVRAGAQRACVEAEIDAASRPQIGAWLRAHALDNGEEETTLLLRRELSATGRGRCAINGRLATVAQLGELRELIVESHTQGSEQSLLAASHQRALFDHHAGTTALRESAAATLRTIHELEAKRAEMLQREQEAEARLDYLKFAIDELESLAIQPGEQDALRADRDRLMHAEDLARGAATALQALSEDSEGNCAAAFVGRASRELEDIVEHDETLTPILRQMQEAASLLDDAAATLSRYLETVEADPDRLAQIDDRVAALKRALRKYGPSEEEALARLNLLQTECESLANRDRERDELGAQLEHQRAEFQRLCAQLTEKRRAAAPAFERDVIAILADLSMPKARIAVLIESPADGEFADSTGSVEFHFSANAGEAPRSLRKVASGGELSRLLLALRCMAADRADVPVMIFDEVDAGLSGTAAARVGRRLAQLGRTRQVLCVTHQASVAACANCHIGVDKDDTSGRAVVTVQALSRTGRRKELARLLDGGAVSATGLRLAEELLNRAAS